MALLPTGETMLDGHFLQESFFPSERLGIAKAVSYTHLDVYKRQLPVLADRGLQQYHAKRG